MKHIYNQPQFGENWFTYKDLYASFIRKLESGSRIVEVGSWKGKSAAFLAVEIINSGKSIQLDCIDKWVGDEKWYENDLYVKTNTLYDLFLSNIKPINHVINPIKLSSTEAALLYLDNSIDVVFIDACHEYAAVKQDIITWLPKVKENGILSGHDYNWADVKKAVHEILGNQITTQNDCWIYEKK